MRILLYILLFCTTAQAQNPQQLFWALQQAPLVCNGTMQDADACAYITRLATAGYTAPQSVKDAVDAFVIGLKTNSLYTKVIDMYPFIGGTAATHAIAFKDATNNLAYGGPGSPIHSATGTQWNSVSMGQNIYGAHTLNSTHLSYYSRTNSQGDMTDIFQGSSTGGQRTLIAIKWGDGKGLYDFYNPSNERISYTMGTTSTAGMFVASRISSTSLTAYRNGAVLARNTTTATTTNLTTAGVTIGGGLFGQYYSNREAAFASFGLGLTDSETATFTTLVNTLQTALGRNVY